MSNAASAASGSVEPILSLSEPNHLTSIKDEVPEYESAEIGMAFTTDDVRQSPSSQSRQHNNASQSIRHSESGVLDNSEPGLPSNDGAEEGPVTNIVAAAAPLSSPSSSAVADINSSTPGLANIPSPDIGATNAHIPSAAPTRTNRVYGLSRDLTTFSADSAYLPSSKDAFRPMGVSAGMMDTTRDQDTHPHSQTLQEQQQQQSSGSGSGSGNSVGVDQERNSKSEKRSIASTSNLENLTSSPNPAASTPSLSRSELPAMPSMTTHGRPAPASSATGQPDGSSQFSIEVIATSFDKRGYPIFSGRAARIRGVIRLKAIVGCHVEIKLGAYICQGSPAAVWDGVALMPPESGGDHKLFTVREKIPLSDSMMRTREGISSISAGSDDFIFETPFDFNLPLGMSTRFVNGEPTISAVALPPSFEVSSESVSRERDLMRSTNISLKSSAASVRSKSSRLTSLAATTNTVGNSIRDVVEKGFGEVYRIGCFYTMEFSLIRDPQPDTTQKKKLFGKSKMSKPTVLDNITVPFIFLGEQSTEQPPPLSIPATLIANAVARPGSFLGDGWQCERSASKWPGKVSKGVKRQVDIEMHMPFPATVHAPSLFPVLIILRPHDSKLLNAVPIDFIPVSPTTGQEESHWGKSSSGGGEGGSGSMHSRHTSVSTQKTRNTITSPTIRQHEERVKANENQQQENVNEGGMLSRFMRSSLSLSRKTSNSNVGVGGSIQASQSAHSLRHTQSRSGASDVEESGSYRPPSIASHTTGGGKSGGVGSIREAVSNKFGRRRPNTAPTSRSSSDGRSRVSGSTMLGSGGQYIGNLSGLVRVSLVQTTFCIGAGPSEPPKNIRKLISMAEVEELDPEALRGMVRSAANTRSTDETTVSGGINGQRNNPAPGVPEEDEHQTLLREALQDQLDNKGVRVLRALFRVGSDPIPSFRCQGIELRYAIKVDLVPFQVRDQHYRARPNSGSTFGASNFSGIDESASSEVGGPISFGLSSSEANSKVVQNGSLSSPIRTTAPVLGSSGTAGLLSSPILAANKPHQSPRLPSYRSSAEVLQSSFGQQSVSSPTSTTFPASVVASPEQAGRKKQMNESSPRFSSGDTVVSTVYADRVQSLDKIEKGIGVLFANVRLVRAAV